MNKPKVAIVHDWLTGMRGGEKCLEVFCELFPDAALFTLVHKKGSVSSTIENMDVRTSFLQKVPFAETHYRTLFPLFPAAAESFDLGGFDLILSSSHCAAKGAKKAEGALHICYCYTPARYAWGLFDEYFSSENPLKRLMISLAVGRFKNWDRKVNKRVDYFIAISHNVKNRIKKYYSRDADVIYPPVDIEEPIASVYRREKGYYLLVSALVPYKRVDIAVRAFNRNKKKLVVVGTGPELGALRRMAGGNITFTGWVDKEELDRYYSECEALIFPGEEDFGIVPVEAQARGKAVIAYGRGGVLETVVPFDATLPNKNFTGAFFYEKTPEALNGAVSVFEENRAMFRSDAAKANAERFGRERFAREIKEYIEKKWRSHLLDTDIHG